MLIFDHIQYLITRHDCVVVAGLGAFVAQRRPARISADGRMLLPPGRMLTFNSVVTHDDGLLAGSIARRNGITYEEARNNVAQQVELVRARLESERTITIPRIGSLTIDADGLFQFSPATETPIASILYNALPSVELPSAVAPEMEEETEYADTPLTIGRRIAMGLRKTTRYAAVVALILAAGTVLTTPVLLNHPSDRASLSLPAVTPAHSVSLPETITVAMHAAHNNGPMAVDAQATKPQVTEAPEVRSTPKVADTDIVTVTDYRGTNPEADFNCFVIVGSCKTESEAHRFIARNGNENSLRIIHSDGYYRIYTAMSNDYERAFVYKSSDSDIARRFPGAWVYTK